jgi:hypothetical protein
MDQLRIVTARWAGIIYSCRNLWEIVFRTNAAEWLNSLNPAYMHFEPNGNNPQSEDTKHDAVKKG